MKRFIALVLALLLGACTSPCGPGHPLSISGVNVITGDSASEFVPDATISVRGAVIQGVSVRRPTGRSCRIALDGAYAIPSLWDMHVHVTKIGEDSLPLFVANGVGGVRDMGGDPAEIQRIQELGRSGALVSPLILSPGPMLEAQEAIASARERGNNEDFSRTRIALTGPEDARPAIERLIALGADFVKLRSTPDNATYEAVLREASAAGLKVFGHPRDSYDPAEAARRGQLSFEHAFYPFPLSRLTEEAREALAQALVESGAAHVPTFTGWRFFTRPVGDIEAALADAAGRIDPRNASISPEMRENWVKYVESRRTSSHNFEAWRGYVERATADMAELHRRGVTVFAGTDAAVPLVYPGASLIDELEYLVREVGLTPTQAIAANSWVASDFLGVQGVGRLLRGQQANIVFLSSDPRADIGALRQVLAVMHNGIYYDRAALDAMIAATAAREAGARRQRPPE